jgi:membrane protein YqaA with SNARE-associated domain
MKIFSKLYDRVLHWSRHPHAPWYLGGLSFAESSFFPIPPDVMLAPMALAQPKKAIRFAVITTIASILGGILGYFIGVFAFDLVEPLIREAGYWDRYEKVNVWFEEWGFWAIFIAGFSPIPYKLFTIAAGVMSMAMVPFVIASAIGRGLRFLLVAGVMSWGGQRFEPLLRAYIDRIGWIVVGAAVIAYLVFSNGA